MAIALDASTPTVAISTGTTTTTGLFTPPASSLLVAVVALGNPTGTTATAATGSVSSSGLTWTLRRRQNDQAGGYGGVEIYVADAPATATARTVSATSAMAGMALQVFVFTGAKTRAAQVGASMGVSTGGGSITVTATNAGSYIVGGFSDIMTVHTLTPLTGTTEIAEQRDATNQSTFGVFYSTNVTATAGAVTTGYNFSGGSYNVEIAALEILDVGSPGTGYDLTQTDAAGATDTVTATLTTGTGPSLAATKFTASGMVRVTVSFGGLTPAAGSATVRRIAADGTNFTVRGADPVTLSAGLATVDDFEVPLDVDCYYTVSDDQSRTASSGVVHLGSSEAFGTPTAWITDPARPSASVPVAMAGKPEWTYPGQSVRLDIIGKARPVAVSSARGSKRGTITFVTLNPASIDDVRNVFSTGQVLLLRAPAGYRWGNMYFDAGDVREAHGFTVLRHSARVWTVDVAEVDRPTYASQGFANTWATAASVYGTWAVMAQQTWLTVMQGTDPNAAGANTFVNPVYGGTVL